MRFGLLLHLKTGGGLISLRRVAQVRAPLLGANLGSAISSPRRLSLASPDRAPSTLTRLPRLLLLAVHSDESCSTANLPEVRTSPPSPDCDECNVASPRTRAHRARCGRNSAFAKRRQPSDAWQRITSSSA